jgi:hypothetical protein
MGLDITACSKMRPVQCDSEDCWHERVYVNPDFVSHADGLKSGCYEKTPGSETISFRAGSYSGYNWWRNELDCLTDSPGAFEKLVYFSDCEGVIGPRTSRELAVDFDRFHGLALKRKGDGTMFYEKYKDWRKAFKLDSNGGFVRFH